MPSFNRVWLGGKSIAESKAVGPAACPFGEEGVCGQVGTRCLAVVGLEDDHMEQPLLVPLTHCSVLKGVI